MGAEGAGVRAGKLDKLRELICHPGTPAAERRAALARLEAILGDREELGTRTRATRSIRIGPSRRPIPLDEFDRLEPFALGLSCGEVVAAVAQACREAECRPDRIDLGWHPERGPVVAACFASRPLPDLERFRSAVRHRFPEARVTLSDFVAEGERRILLFLAPAPSAHGREPEGGGR
ncbi:MAG: hypothetical protein NZP72_00265 [Geminicoccaceae bacterium]|nr:hypothetical protein [Geminicoccaceae bacterium]